MRYLIVGSSGMLGSELVRQLSDQSGIELMAWDRENIDVTDGKRVFDAVTELKPDVIFNCAAYNNVDKAESEPEAAYVLNADAPGFLARAASACDATLVHYSTNYVFAGDREEGYTEEDFPDPQSVYASSKYAGELQVKDFCPKHYIVRLSMLFGKRGVGAHSKASFPELIRTLSQEKKEFDFVIDEIGVPTSAKDLAHASVGLISGNYEFGVYHLVNEGSASWYDYAQAVFAYDQDITLNRVSGDVYARPAPRPHYGVLKNTKYPLLRDWKIALDEFLSEQYDEDTERASNEKLLR